MLETPHGLPSAVVEFKATAIDFWLPRHFGSLSLDIRCASYYKYTFTQARTF